VREIELNPYAPPSADFDPGVALDDGQLLRATRSQRWWAAFLDGLLYVPLLIVGGFVIVASQINLVADRLQFTLTLQACLLPLALYQWILIARTGQSLGKRWTRIKIVRTNGKPVDFVSGVVLRHWILYGVPLLVSLVLPSAESLPTFVSLVDVLFIFGLAHRCLHDYLAGTQVVALPDGAL
jgi:uncharacterized RDD family membrane protein YckC